METILTSISLGLLATTSPCILPLYPGFLAYLSGNRASQGKSRYFLGMFVFLGVLTMMLTLGGIIAVLSVSIGSALAVIIPLADILILVLGVLLLLDINPFKQLPQIRVPGLSHPFANAYVYGLLYGPIALPCSGPLVVGIFAFSLTAGEALSKLSVFFWFGIGFGIPLLVLSLVSGSLQRQITRLFAIHSRKINVCGGILLVAVGLYDFLTNWDLILAYLS
jgi:cytochrome c-type biogenesis protein